MSEKLNGNNFDLGNIITADDSNGEFLHLMNPGNGEPLTNDDGSNVGIYLLGKDSDAYRLAQRKITNRRLSQKGNTSITAERIEIEANEILANCTVSWTGIVYNGEVLVCDIANAKMIYKDLPWLKEQVDEFVAERANYLEK